MSYGYLSKYDLIRKLSDYQVQLLLLLKAGCRAVTNEGVNYRCWLEFKDSALPFRLRKDTLQHFYDLGLLTPIDDPLYRPGTYCYGLSAKGLQIAYAIPDARRNHCLSLRSFVTRLRDFQGLGLRL